MSNLPPLPALEDVYAQMHLRNPNWNAYMAPREAAVALALGVVSDQMRAYGEACAAAERERCLEMVGDEQLYPTQPECSVVNPILHRILQRIEDGTTTEDLTAAIRARGET